jgi:hypothetical protein
VTQDRALPSQLVEQAHCLVEQAIAAPRQVEVLIDGRWWPGIQRGWCMYDDGSGWRAAVTYVAESASGPEARDRDVPVEQVRVVG